MTTITHCKVCDSSIPTPELGNDYWCIHCRSYRVYYWEALLDYTEVININGWYLDFLSRHKEAEVRTQYKFITTISMDELTPELAKQWLAKLKLYTVFQ